MQLRSTSQNTAPANPQAGEFEAAINGQPDTLTQARTAWAEKCKAESELSRLRKYKGQNPGMKEDRSKWAARLSVATATLERVLGGAA